ncbi:MAG: hypothetical protein ACD_51C00316G0019 [uncultured bacterium]|nr:MAG: hypothetical protein ACD_51C00316G0019 [uncultured bacterium]OGJ48768.1 MAG: hypothetical protein A2344_02060 [Candidatus Peregrinibacteria bacterium RIFOXYB12_FULL_41_12]
MRVTILQPSYIPWIGYFDQINKSDVFVFFDDVQYTRRDWRNRNRIKTTKGEEKYLTVPVEAKGNYDALIKDIKIHYDNKCWEKSHLGLIKENYRSAEFFPEVFPILERHLLEKYEYLSDLNCELTRELSEYLGIKHVQFVKSSGLGITNYNDSTEHLVNICKKFNATSYLTGDSAKSYMNEEMFKKENIELKYHGYKHPEYNQLHGKFLPYLSIIDLLFNCGKKSLSILKA